MVWRGCRVSFAGGQGKTISLRGPLGLAEIKEGVYHDCTRTDLTLLLQEVRFPSISRSYPNKKHL